jgi:bacterioferritin-associated ferredoxin
MAEFFLGRREVAHFVTHFHREKANLECRIFERWKEIDITIARCGHAISFELTKQVGLSEKDTQSLEASLKGTIGVRGLAQLESEIRSTISREVTWTRMEERKKSFTCIPPKCGRCTSVVYQLIREYDLVYRDSRWFHRGWQMNLAEHTNCHDHRPNRIPNDPVCKCAEVTDPNLDGVFNVDMGVVSMQVPFSRIDSGLLLDFDGQKVGFSRVEAGSFSVDIPKKLLPDVVIFLGDLEKEVVRGHFMPYREAPLANSLEQEEASAVPVPAAMAIPG